MHQQVNRIGPTFSQPTFSQPKASICLFNPAAKVTPCSMLGQTNVCRRLLAQNVVPVPFIQASKRLHRTKFGIIHQQNRNSWRQKTADISQQSQLGSCGTVTPHLLYPRPGNRSSSFSISQRNHQQLMSKAHFGTIYNQHYLLKMICLLLQPTFCYRLIPRTRLYRRVLQPSAQAMSKAEQLSWTRYFCLQSGSALPIGFDIYQSAARQSYVLE